MSSRLSHRYQPYYCEENVWHLCGEPEFQSDGAGRQALVALISNVERQVALWGQREAPSPLVPVVWDYHVVLMARSQGGDWEVWDLDSVLGFPLAASVYLELTFPDLARLPAVYAPLFRLVPAAEYRRELRTDRRHMRRDDGTYLSPPPTWPAIGEGRCNLMRFIDMRDDFLGEVFDPDGLRRRLL